MNGLNDLPKEWANNWSLSDLEFELRRRNLQFGILNDTHTEYQRRTIAIVLIEADALVRSLKKLPEKTEETFCEH